MPELKNYLKLQFGQNLALLRYSFLRFWGQVRGSIGDLLPPHNFKIWICPVNVASTSAAVRQLPKKHTLTESSLIFPARICSHWSYCAWCKTLNIILREGQLAFIGKMDIQSALYWTSTPTKDHTQYSRFVIYVKLFKHCKLPSAKVKKMLKRSFTSVIFKSVIQTKIVKQTWNTFIFLLNFMFYVNSFPHR